MRSRRYALYLAVWIAGAATMGIEMSASRLLAPYFGNSLPVWAALIGLLLAYLALGHFLGGRLADRCPDEGVLYQIIGVAGIGVGLIPYLARPILHLSMAGLGGYQVIAVAGSLLSVLALLALPVIALGCVSPFAVRLTLQSPASSGNVAGRLYALSTIGSLIGTFLPVFVLIPNWGTQRTLASIALALLATAMVGLLLARRRIWLYVLFAALLLALQVLPQGAIKPTAGLIYEAESAYNYIQVLQDGDQVLLRLNEGEGIQSVYRPNQILTGYVFDYFLLVPFFRNRVPQPPAASLCLIGLAGGTSALQYSSVFGPLPIDGVEIDPSIVEAARRFMGLDLPNLNVIVGDGRYYLARSRRQYDVVIVDAYRPPYIPFQLTTIEFFRQVRDHLTEDGVLALNVARTETDYALVDAIAATLKAVYPKVYVLDTQSDLNSVVIAPRQPTELATIEQRIAGLHDAVLGNVGARARGRLRESTAPMAAVLTDDRAPVEQIVHGIVARYLLGSDTGSEVRE